MPHALIRVKEWTEWLPAELEPTGVESPTPQGMAEKTTTLHNGVAGVELSSDEELMRIDLLATGIFKEAYLFEEDDRTSDSEHRIFGLFVFRAVIKKSTTAKDAEAQINRQGQFLIDAKAQEERIGRDRRSDLHIVEHNHSTPTPRVPPV